MATYQFWMEIGMNDDMKLLIYVLFILVCAGIVGTFDREAEELTQTHTRDAALHKTADNLLTKNWKENDN